MTTLSQSHFRQIQQLAKELWGLNLTDRKRQLVCNRVGRFLRKSAFDSIEAYLRHLQDGADESDKLLFFDALSTNVTSFFRERAAFDYLEREFYTALTRHNLTRPGRRIRIWSAACSTGPEPYSIAIHALEHLPELPSWDFKILATDLAQSALDTARRAEYPWSMVAALDRRLIAEYFLTQGRGDDRRVTVAPAVRNLVTFGRVNLMDPWRFKGPFDVVFLRNVMIYFDRPTRERLVQRVSDLLRPDGILVIGSAETLSGCRTALRTGQPSVYVK